MSPRTLTLFLKRLRERFRPLGVELRFYAVGEYGERYGRAHYHVVLYGLPDALLGRHERCCCVLCLAWGKGLVHVGQLTAESAAYVATYAVTRKTRNTDVRVNGRHPEFARMSRKPGLGAKAIAALKTALSRGGEVEDVPMVFRAAGKLWPLGRYLRRKLREAMGMAPGEPSVVAARRALELLAEVHAVGGSKSWTAQRELQREGETLKAEAKERIINQRRVF